VRRTVHPCLFVLWECQLFTDVCVRDSMHQRYNSLHGYLCWMLRGCKGIGECPSFWNGFWVCLLVTEVSAWVLGGVGVQHAILVSLVTMSHGVRACSVHPGVHW